MLTLQFQGDFDNVSEFGFVDTPEQPFYFTFRVECGSCHEVHPNDIAFTAHELHALPSSRGEANFSMKCKFCGKDGNVTTEPKLATYSAEAAQGKPVSMTSFDCRGLVLHEFVPRGEFWASAESGSKFTLEFDDGEWYDYDEKAGQEVSITGTQWSIVKTK